MKLVQHKRSITYGNHEISREIFKLPPTKQSNVHINKPNEGEIKQKKIISKIRHKRTFSEDSTQNKISFQEKYQNYINQIKTEEEKPFQKKINHMFNIVNKREFKDIYTTNEEEDEAEILRFKVMNKNKIQIESQTILPIESFLNIT